MVRIEFTADDSLAEILARSRFGMAMAAMIRIIATTINNSISEKPLDLRIGGPFFAANSRRNFCPLNAHSSKTCRKLQGNTTAVTGFLQPARSRETFTSHQGD